MSILTSNHQPRDAEKVLARALKRLHQPGASHSGLRQLAPDDTMYLAHHAVYELDADALANGSGFDQARRSGSRYLLVNKAGKSCGAVEIETDAAGTIAGEFKSLNQGPFVEGTENAIRLAEAYPGSDQSEFSVLRVAALKLLIVQVESRPKRFYVVSPAPAGLETDRPYSVTELLPAVQAMAQALFKHHAGPVKGADTLTD